MPDPEDLEEERTLNGSMRITRIGRGHYQCQSESEPEKTYVVDLLENRTEGHIGALGSCTCDDFKYRLFPRWKKVRRPYDSMRCKHLHRVRNHVMDYMTEHYINEEKRQK